MSRVVEKDSKGIKIKQDPVHKEKKDKAKGANKDDRLEAKIDLIMEKLGIKL